MLAGALGSLVSLETLLLSDNEIGDAGLTALADVCASGALAQLTVLNLGGNSASQQAKDKLESAFGQRKCFISFD